MDEDELQKLYAWIDDIPLTRPKKNVPRDFSDGVMVAEIIHHFIPGRIELHNYTPANAIKQKLENWKTLNQRVLRKLELSIPDNVLDGIVACKAGVVEVVLNNLRLKIEKLQKDGTAFADVASVTPSPSGQYGRPVMADFHSGSVGLPQQQQQQQQYYGAQPPHQAQALHAQALQQQVVDQAALADAQKSLAERDRSLMEYQQTVDMLQAKIRKLEQLVELKDRKADELTRKLRANGIKP